MYKPSRTAEEGPGPEIPGRLTPSIDNRAFIIEHLDPLPPYNTISLAFSLWFCYTLTMMIEKTEEKTKMKAFKKSQGFRVIINGISFFTTKGSIVDGVGDFTKVNESVKSAITELERIRKSDPAVGLAGTWCGFDVQLSMV